VPGAIVIWFVRHYIAKGFAMGRYEAPDFPAWISGCARAFGGARSAGVARVCARTLVRKESNDVRLDGRTTPVPPCSSSVIALMWSA